MTRTIKFRVWHKGTLNNDGSPDRNRMSPIAWNPGELMEAGIRTGKVMDEEDFIFLQFTGLLDKNGKEIYEGDILQFQKDGGIGAVEWNERQARFSWRKLGLTRVIANHRLHIIGNIYENSDLLV